MSQFRVISLLKHLKCDYMLRKSPKGNIFKIWLGKCIQQTFKLFKPILNDLNKLQLKIKIRGLRGKYNDNSSKVFCIELII